MVLISKSFDYSLIQKIELVSTTFLNCLSIGIGNKTGIFIYINKKILFKKSLKYFQ